MTINRFEKRKQAKAQVLPRYASIRTEALAPALFAAVLGSFILFGVGFVDAAAVHNVAHDTRHSVSFPCH
jgi:cobalt transporter subunit CbtB